MLSIEEETKTVLLKRFKTRVEHFLRDNEVLNCQSVGQRLSKRDMPSDCLHFVQRLVNRHLLVAFVIDGDFYTPEFQFGPDNEVLPCILSVLPYINQRHKSHLDFCF